MLFKHEYKKKKFFPFSLGFLKLPAFFFSTLLINYCAILERFHFCSADGSSKFEKPNRKKELRG
jgi:hypothetical protein